MGLFSVLGTLAGGLLGGGSSSGGAKDAARIQAQSAQQGIAEQARQFNITRQDFAPFQEAGVAALGNMGDLLGLNGAEGQASEINLLRESPLYKALYGAGEEAVLQNASATGGLRGGNTVTGLAEFGEGTLANLIQQQLAGYAGVAGMGQGAAGAVGNFGANAAGNSAMLRNQGAAGQAQASLVRGGVGAQNWQNVGTAFGEALGSFNWKSLF